MLKFLKREIYLGQGILVFVVYITILIAGGIYYTDSLSAFNDEPISSLDLQMVTTLKNIEEYPKNVENYAQLGSIYLKKGSPKEAKNAYIKALSLDANHIEALSQLATLYKKEKNYAKAEDFLKRIIAIDPNLSQVKFTLATVLIEQKEFHEAEQILSNLENFETNADYFYYIGLVCENLNRLSEAQSNYEKALMFDPQYSEAQAGLKRVLLAKSKLERVKPNVTTKG